jgi:hypothetical protein
LAAFEPPAEIPSEAEGACIPTISPLPMPLQGISTRIFFSGCLSHVCLLFRFHLSVKQSPALSEVEWAFRLVFRVEQAFRFQLRVEQAFRLQLRVEQAFRPAVGQRPVCGFSR